MLTTDPRVALPSDDRQYHIDLGPGERAEYIRLPGDPDRIARIAERFESVEVERRHREFVSVTGSYRGIRISAVATGIGTDNVEIVVAEILALVPKPTFVRIGSSGALRPEIELGDLVITTGAVRLETTTSWYVHEGYPAVADPGVVLALVEAAARLGLPAHVGITATAPGFFGPQGRPIPQLPIRYPDLADEMRRQGVLNFEMEASAVLVLAGLAGCRAGAVCGVFAQRDRGEFADAEMRRTTESRTIDVGLEALSVIVEMDRQRDMAAAPLWRPSLWR